MGLADLVLPVVGGGFIAVSVGALALVGGVRAASSRRRRSAASAAGGDVHTAPAIPLACVLDDVDRLLLQCDDAITAADQERLYADAEFGADRTVQLQQAVARARRDLDASFAQRRLIDSQNLEVAGEQGARNAAQAIRDRLHAALTELQSATTAIGRLRDEAAHASSRLVSLRERVDATRARIPGIRGELRGVAEECSHEAVVAVAAHPDRAERALADAMECLSIAEKGLGDPSGRGEAIAALHRAEHDVDEAVSLLDVADDLEEEIARSRVKLPEARRAMLDLLVQAEAVSGSDPRIVQAVALGRSVASELDDAARRDPRAALGRVTEATVRLQDVVTATQEAYVANSTVARTMTRALESARSEVRVASTYMESHRTRIQAPARALLGEAQQLLSEAESLLKQSVTSEREMAQIGERAQEAARRARDAFAKAQDDVEARAADADDTWQPGRQSEQTASDVIGDVLGSLARAGMMSRGGRGNWPGPW
ncbi:coiled-coil domain-containing protein [Devriesea agamarum]|uniref:hypothetical protein n=1 Tax=Devriesea agamarum TaxID=472569 RepID=UPI00071E3FB8|nr:hypothetical protein [Devriesea agamarum]